MAVSKEFAGYVHELFAPLGRISMRRMFSGAGIYADDIIFALIIADVLYLKTDAGNREQFSDEGLEAFSYENSKGRVVQTSYHRAPDEAMDSPALMLPWARSALAAALRSQSNKTRRK